MSNESHRQQNEVFSAEQARAMGHQTRNVLKDDFNFEVPVELVPLPSAGVCYNADSPLFNMESLEIRAMTAKEEDILTSRALIKNGTVITQLLKSCLVDKNLDPNEMLSGDRNAVMTALRITGYGDEYHTEVDCPACGERSKQEFNLSELPIKRLQIQPVVPGANQFKYTLPITKKEVVFKFLDGNDENEIQKIIERRKKQGAATESLVTTRLQYQLVSIQGITEKHKINMFVRNMPARDSLSLRNYIDEHEPGIKMEAWMECPSCFESSEVKMPLGASFFWPNS